MEDSVTKPEYATFVQMHEALKAAHRGLNPRFRNAVMKVDAAVRRANDQPILIDEYQTEIIALTEREKEIFEEMLAALRGVVSWFDMPSDADALPALAKAKAAIAKAECVSSA